MVEGTLAFIFYYKDKKEDMRGQKKIAVVCMSASIVLGALGVGFIRSAEEQTGSLETGERLFSVVNRTGDSMGESEETMRKESEDEDITELMQRYFTAVSECDMDTLNDIIATNRALDENQIRRQGELIDCYQNISCYVLDGLVENTYIVYVYYEVVFLGIKTPAPGLSRMYICRNEDGAVYINQEDLKGEIRTYMEEVEQTNAVQRLIREVDDKLSAACRKDEELDKLVRYLNGGYKTGSDPNQAKHEGVKWETE